MNKLLPLLLATGCLLLWLAGCRPAIPADLVVFNARVYTVDRDSTVSQAFAIRAGRFVEVGSSAFIRAKYQGARQIDAAGKPVFPGFIDSLAHFAGYARRLHQADLRRALLAAQARWAAKGHFSAKEKGSIERGKYANFVVLEQDIMVLPESRRRQVQVLQTFVHGEQVYKKQ